MNDRQWPTAAGTCLSVALFVAVPSQISITTHDRIRIDRVTDAGAQRHGDLLAAGTNAVRLEAGTYVFRTAHDARVDLIGSPSARAVATTMGGKDDPPDPDFVSSKGDGSPDRVPALTVRVQ